MNSASVSNTEISDFDLMSTKSSFITETDDTHLCERFLVRMNYVSLNSSLHI